MKLLLTSASIQGIKHRVETQAEERYAMEFDSSPGHRPAGMRCRGVRGATTADENTPEAILSTTRELLYIMLRVNRIEPEDVACIYFTTTVDLNATYPALAARQLGWYDAALMCGHEMQVPGGLEKCIRVMIHWNTTLSSKEVTHVYLRNAKRLRPDRKTLPEVPLEEIAEAVRSIDLSTLKFDPDGK
jgi:chorismate mutase